MVPLVLTLRSLQVSSHIHQWQISSGHIRSHSQQDVRKIGKINWNGIFGPHHGCGREEAEVQLCFQIFWTVGSRHRHWWSWWWQRCQIQHHQKLETETGKANQTNSKDGQIWDAKIWFHFGLWYNGAIEGHSLSILRKYSFIFF